MTQVDEVEKAAVISEQNGHTAAVPILRRGALVLAIACIDTYFHEKLIKLLAAEARRSETSAASVARYARRVTAEDVSGSSGEDHLRSRLSYITLVSPNKIDEALVAAGLDAATIWRDAAFILGSRPDRLRRQLELFYDRRNQIAHEGDWDSVQFAFRVIEQAHLADCIKHSNDLMQAIDASLP